jgi:hypothetical protein
MLEVLSIVLVVSVFVAFAAFLVWRHHRVRSANDDLLTSGTPATGVVVRVGRVLGENDVFTVRLRLEDREIESQWYLPPHVLPSVQPGRSVAVRLDADRARAPLDARAMGFG